MEKSLLRCISHLKSVRWCGYIGQKSKHPGKILGVHYFQLSNCELILLSHDFKILY